jgi:hypothetical protein
MVKGENGTMGRGLMGAPPEGGAEVCPGGEAWPRWRAADPEVGARSRGGAVGKTDNHTESASESAQGRGWGRDRSRRSA